MDMAKHKLEVGAKYPYDAPDDWHEHHSTPPPAKDWAHAAARGVMIDLSDRVAIRHALQGIDQEVRAELVASLAEIIRAAAKFLD